MPITVSTLYPIGFSLIKYQFTHDEIRSSSKRLKGTKVRVMYKLCLTLFPNRYTTEKVKYFSLKYFKYLTLL
ncbi:hypothetical protein SDC9_112295 [bioreactor metagenome]|uniref:Uncharacterized protein n=1 Tax=bioreactor metagenome TaxID=1076179 RepID=A0A645BIW2_9ZZZZ